MSMRQIISGLLAGGLIITGQANAAPEDDLRAMIEQGHHADAYQAAKAQPDQVGNPLFDVYYGIAAIEVGQASEGVLALERYRMSFPQDANAVLYMSRGYLMLGEAQRARAELEALLETAPSDEIATVARALLESASGQESAAGGGVRAYVEAGLGADSNVNGGVGSSVVTLPVFGQIVVPRNITRTGDNFTHLAAGMTVNHVIDPGLSIFGGLDFSTRLHFNDQKYDQDVLGGVLGVALKRGGNLWRATASQQTLWLENDRYRSVTGLAGEWGTEIHPKGFLNAFVQYARFDYGEPGGGISDADFYGLGVGYRRVFDGAYRPTLALAVTGGDDRNDRGHHELSRKIWGASATFSFVPMPRWNVSASLSHQESDYQDEQPYLAVTRHDRFDSFILGAGYQIDRQMSVRGEMSYFDNASNIELYKYDRLQGMVKLRYDF